MIKDSHALDQAVKLAQKAGDVDTQLEKSQRDVEQAKKGCLSELKRIGLWSGELAELIELSLPLSDTVHQFENRFSEIADEGREIEKERMTNEKELLNAHHRQIVEEANRIKGEGIIQIHEL